MSANVNVFFTQNPIFTLSEFRESLGYEGSSNKLWGLLRYHLKKNHLLKIRNGVYAYIPPGSNVTDPVLDQYLVASKLTEDAVIGYQSALGFWGFLHSLRNDLVYLTNRRLNKTVFNFQEIDYLAVSFPKKLVLKNKTLFGVKKVDRLGVDILVTSLARTFVDVLDRPYLKGDCEELYQSLSSIPYLDLDQVVEYVCLLENKTTAAIVGFFLDLFRDKWYVKDEHLDKIKTYTPKQPVYLDKESNQKNKMIKKWNLIVPENIITKNWEEPNEDI